MKLTAESTEIKKCNDALIQKVLAAAIQVRRELGPGLLESIYALTLIMELQQLNIQAKRQVEVPAKYRGHNPGTGLRADIIVEDCLLLELKCIDEFSPVHTAQTITYLKLLQFKRGIILNFNKALLKQGIKRISI